AREHDNAERGQLRKLHFEAVKKANERHQVLSRDLFNKLAKLSPKIGSERADIADLRGYVDVLARAVRLDREILGAPIAIEVSHKGENVEQHQATVEATAEATKRFEAGPEIYAAVAQILAEHEVLPQEAANGEPDR